MSVMFSIEASFRPLAPFGFTATMPSEDFHSPPYVIADAISNRVVDRESVVMPDGCDEDMLENIQGRTGKIGGEPLIFYREASVMRNLGIQLLELHRRGEVQPPFEEREVHSINVLINATNPKF